MKTLILAAGKGTRISRYLSGNPKCTVDIGGKKLIQYTIDLLKSRGIKDIGIVVGYKHEVIEEILENQDILFYYNPFFDVTNSIVSAWMAKEFFDENEDILIMNGDVFVEEKILDDILAEQSSPVMFADETRKEEADYKFYYENSVLIKYGKELTGTDITGEYVGIAKMKGAFVKKFISRLDEMIGRQEHSVWWENVLYSMTNEIDVYIKDVAGKFWAEVDYVEDYERIKKYVNSNLEI